MATTTITLSDDQLVRLRVLALSSRRSLDEVLHEAIEAYLVGLPESQSARVTEPDRNAVIDAALARVRSQVPADLTPDEIDAEIDAAWEEVRRERRARDSI